MLISNERVNKIMEIFTGSDRSYVFPAGLSFNDYIEVFKEYEKLKHAPFSVCCTDGALWLKACDIIIDRGIR